MSRFASASAVAVLIAATVFTGCFESSTSTNTNTNTSTDTVYVAVGNSLTAGFQSGGLRADFQKASYPALLAKQMGVKNFQLPLIDSPGLGTTLFGSLHGTPLHLTATGSIVADTLKVDPSTLLSNATYPHPYNDLAVPGMTTRDFMHAYDSNSAQVGGNGFFNIILRGALFNNLSMMDQAISLKPTVMTMWVGSNDILGGITLGTVVEGVTVTPVAAYTSMMDTVFDTLLTKTSARIFVANIPSITSIPYVTTVPTYVFDPKTFKPAVDTSVKWVTEEKNVQYVLLPALSKLATGMGLPKALGGADVAIPANLTLTADEVATANKLTDGYNAYLKAKCDAHSDRLTLVDVNALLVSLNKGEISGLSSRFALLDSTSAFSLDGIHPNSKGYTVVANVYLDAINKTLGTSYPKL